MSIVNRNWVIALVLVLVAAASLQSTHAGKIYWSQNNYSESEIQRANLDGTNVETVLWDWTYGLAVDSIDRKIYFGSSSLPGEGGHVILRANLDGSNPEVVFDFQGLGPLYIALDRNRGKYYVSLSGFEFCGGLWRLDMYGSGAETLNGDCILGVAVDSAAAKLYWAQTSPEYLIVRANLDGSGAETVLTLDASPIGLVLDPARGKLYWSQQGTDHVLRANLDGSNREILVSEEGSTEGGIALDLRSEKLYWAYVDSEVSQIRRADLDGSNPETILDARPRGQIAIDPVQDGPDVPAVSTRATMILVLILLVLSTLVLRRRGSRPAS